MNDPLFSNKLAFSVLAALLLFFGLPHIAGALMGGGHHGGEFHLAYPIEFETTAGAGEADAGPQMGLGDMMAEATMAGGERRIALCKSCHTFEKGGADGTGPHLWGVVGRDVASVAGFNYSNALKEFGGEWTYERLDGYLKNSQEYVPGTTMAQRVSKAEQRAEILVYLASMSDNPMPFPAPTAVEAPSAEAEAGE